MFDINLIKNLKLKKTNNLSWYRLLLHVNCILGVDGFNFYKDDCILGVDGNNNLNDDYSDGNGYGSGTIFRHGNKYDFNPFR